ncbi:MAG: hypothetical protein QOD75_2443 [Blastocatellia bacterium]|jgi:uncharacterized damage-inducible protein DinB|nr:hypothetical protein [Blastocatellia bacterium]
MKLSDTLLPEWDHEMANTRKTLERVPTEKLDWKPHEKSSAMGALATHLANIPTWAIHTLTKESLDLAPVGEPPPRSELLKSTAEILATFDKNVTSGREAIAAASDEEFFKPWALLHGGNQILAMPKMAVLRGFVMSHNIHHRAQLGVYLRLNDVAVPSIYGPSADETSF